MNVTLIGLGSIGRKHIHALRTVAPSTNIYALRSGNASITLEEGVINLLSWKDIPENTDFFIVCNPTSAHLETLQKLLVFGKPVFIEKPALMCLDEAEDLIKAYKARNIMTYTACNLRFHPLIRWAKENLLTESILEVSAYAGSFLPDWRMNIDYRHNYSAISAKGGGVHLDLIHEIDYLTYLFGMPERIKHLFRKVSNLEIDSVDSAVYWLLYRNFSATVTLNYFRRTPKRTVEFVTEKDVFIIDFINGKVSNGLGEILFSDNLGMLKTYEYQMQYFLNSISKGVNPMNTLEEAVNTLKISLGQW
jgi:predicted dehydrogenase